MRQENLRDMATMDLVRRFAEIGCAQDEALLDGKVAKFNRLFDLMANVSSELKNRNGDQRRALMVLYNFNNMQVRLKAAIHTLAVAPEDARTLLEEISKSQWNPQSGDAGMSLWNLDRGIFKPT